MQTFSASAVLTDPDSAPVPEDFADDRRRRSRRAQALLWLRRFHGWIGLWGATLGLLFGLTGILLNHRAVLKIPLPPSPETTVQWPLPQPAPMDAKAMADWLRQELHLDHPNVRAKEEPTRPVAWGDQSLRQPAHWMISLTTPALSVQADWWVGNGLVTVKRTDQNLLATLNNLHKGVGLGIGWVLLADTLAGSIILLSLTGVILWTQLNRRRLVGAVIGISSLVAVIVLPWQAL